MVGRQQVGPVLRQVLAALDLEPEQAVDQRAVEREQHRGERLERRPARLEPALLLGRRLADLAGAGGLGLGLLDLVRAGRAALLTRASASSLSCTPKRSPSSIVRLIQSKESSPRSSCGLVSRVKGLGAKRSSSHCPDLGEPGRIEQRAVARRELGPALGRRFAGLGPLEHLVEQMAAQLADLGARQGLGRDREVAEPLVGGELARALLDRAAQPLLRLLLPAAQDLDLGHDQGDQAAAALEHRELVDQRALRVDRLDLVGEDVLAAGEHDQLLAAAADVEVAGVVEPAEIARAEEAVGGEGLGGGLGIVPVAREQVGPARLDLALPGGRLGAVPVAAPAPARRCAARPLRAACRRCRAGRGPAG